jgi:hypothetical protein
MSRACVCARDTHADAFIFAACDLHQPAHSAALYLCCARVIMFYARRPTGGQDLVEIRSGDECIKKLASFYLPRLLLLLLLVIKGPLVFAAH